MFNGWRITRTGIVFILGTIVLIGLVVGGIWLVRERGEQARRQEAVKIAEQNLEDQSQAQTETKPETNDETDSAPAATEDEANPVTTTASRSDTLPETGPGDIAQVIAVGVVTLAAGYYLTSRRAARAL
jgi:FtsZ-interacting cell division protein ZipA